MSTWYAIGGIVAFVVLGEIALRVCTNRLGKRAHTIATLVRTVGHVTLFVFLVFWLLRIVGIDPTPLLASAGVVGLAIPTAASPPSSINPSTPPTAPYELRFPPDRQTRRHHLA